MPEVVEKQVAVEVIAADFEADLSAHEGEALAEFEQELLDVVDEALFQVPFAADVGVADEIER